MKNKTLLTILFFVLAIGKSQAQQIEVNINVSPPYQLSLDGLTNQLLATVRNTNLEDPITDINFRLELYGPKGLHIYSTRVFNDDIDLEAGEVRTFIGNDWEGLYGSTDLTIEPVSEEQRLLDTQSFRDGVYKICLTAYSTITQVQLSSGVPSGCDDFTVEVPEPPVIIFPTSNFKIPNSDFLVQVNWTQLNINNSPSYTLEIVDATQFSHSSFAVEEMFMQAESVFFEDNISSFSYVVEDVDWEEGHEYEIRVTSSFGDNEGVLYDAKIHSRPVRIIFEGNAVVADTYVPEPEEEIDEPEIEEEIAQSEDVVTEAVMPEPVVIVPAPANDIPGTVAVNDTIYVGTNGEFKVILSELTGTKSAYNGKGTVFIDWLQARVNVSFKKITIAENKKILSGNVIADLNDNPPTYSIDWPLEVVTNNTWTNTMAGDVVDWVEGVNGEEVSYKNLNELSTPLSMPFGLNFGTNNKFVLTEMVFTKTESKFNIIAAKSTPLDWGNPQTIGFIAKEIIFHPASIEPTPKRLELVANIAINDSNLNTSYTFISPTDNSVGCYMEWGENGFSTIGLELETELSREWMIPVNDNGTDKVKITLTAQSASWDDVLFTGNLVPSEIVGTGGVEIVATNISYDMSDALNPTGIVFPTGYQGETATHFRGFYAKSLKLKLPEAWKASSNGPIEIDVTNMIIDNMGVSLNAEATDIADFNTTSVVDMAASIDKVTIKIIENSLTDAIIEGKLALPISDVTEITDDSKIDYSASLHIISNQQNNQNEESYFQLTLNPTTDQEIDFDLISSKFKLEQTSNITARVGKDNMSFKADLSGEVNMSGLEVGPISLNSVGMDVQHLNFEYDSRPNKGFAFNKAKNMAWGFSSPQKYLSSESSNKGFSLTFTAIEYEDKIKETGEVMRGALLLTTAVNLTDNIVGDGTIAITAAIKKDNNSIAKFKPIYVKTALDSLSVNGDLGAVMITGSLKIRDHDPVYGDGFKGELQAQFKTVKAKVTAIAEFGTVTDFNYWSVQAGLDLPTPIVLAAGLSFHGLGGGAYYNMQATKNANKDVSWAKKYTFKPKKNLAGLKLMALLGAPKIETYNADVEISAAIGVGSNSGIKKIGFSGDLWVGAGKEPEERAKAPIKGAVDIEYDFVESIFHLTADATVNMKAITAKQVGMVIHADGSTGLWYFKFGDPITTNKINVNLLGVGLDIDSYFMFGNDIPTPDYFTDTFKNGYKAALGHVPGPGFNPTTEDSSPGSYASNGAGIALGIGFNFKAGGYIPLGLGYHAGIMGTAGAELNLSLLEYTYLKNNNLGYNGWQAGGSIGFYASVEAGIYEMNKGNYTSVFTLADFAGGGYIIGRFPNPVWVTGKIEGRVKLLCLFGGCLINTSASVGFDYGEKKPRGNANVDVQIAEENEMVIETRDRVLENIDKHIIKYIHPKTPFSFSRTNPIAVKYHTAPNELFELPDAGKTRVFNFYTTVILEEINPMTCRPNRLPLRATTNEIGEKLYTAESELNWPGKGISLDRSETNTNFPSPMNFGANSNTSNTITNNLAPQTNYKLVIHTILKEYVGDSWENSELEGNTIEETIEYKFRTAGTFKTLELIAADNLFTKMRMSDYYKMTLEEQYTFSSQFKGLFNPDGKPPYISEDGECECSRLEQSDKLFFYSGIENGLFESPHQNFGAYPTSYRDYPPVQSTSDAIARLANQPINNNTNSPVTNYNSGSINASQYSTNTFNYSIINTASNGSFISL